MDPYYEKDVQAGILQPEFAQELVDALWLKYSEWVWTISANTADYFAGYNQFQNLTVGGKTKFACVDGPDFDGFEVDFDEAMHRGTMYRDFEAHAREAECNLLKKEVE